MRVILAAVLAAVLLMVWGFVFWMGLSEPLGMLGTLENADAVHGVLESQVPESGVYFVPWTKATEGPEFDAFVEKHKAGPIAQIFINRQGLNPMSAAIYIKGFLHFLVSALLAGIILSLCGPALPNYSQRLAVVFLLGVFAAVVSNLASPIWWHHPWGFWLKMCIFTAGGWLLAGLVMAAIIKPPRYV